MAVTSVLSLLFVTVPFVCLKAKDTYHARCFEFEKLKRENAKQGDCERAEMRMKRARALMFFAIMTCSSYYTQTYTSQICINILSRYLFTPIHVVRHIM